MDWYSRKVLSWRVSNSRTADFCVEALEEAIAKYGAPDIFNTDQGSQTASSFIRRLGGSRQSWHRKLLCLLQGAAPAHGA